MYINIYICLSGLVANSPSGPRPVHRPDRSTSIRSVDGVENLAEVEKEVVVPGASISPRFSEFVPISSSVGGLIHDDDDDDVTQPIRHK
jgi:hypothetical protein